jgi:hypothetical protein
MRLETKIGLLRFVAALIAGLVLSFVFMYLLANIVPRAFESLAEFVGRILGLGFEGAVAELLLIVIGSATVFAISAWFLLRSWGPLRRQVP